MKLKKKKKRTLVASILLLGLLVGGAATMAISIAQTGTVTNLFKVASISTDITEEFGPDLTKKVKVTNANTATSPAFVRVRVSCSPEAIKPALDMNVGNADSWVDGGDGFYYYVKPLAPGSATDQELLNQVRQGNEGDNEQTNPQTLYGLGLNGTEFDITIYQEAVVATKTADETGKVNLADIKAAFAKAANR